MAVQRSTLKGKPKAKKPSSPSPARRGGQGGEAKRPAPSPKPFRPGRAKEPAVLSTDEKLPVPTHAFNMNCGVCRLATKTETFDAFRDINQALAEGPTISVKRWCDANGYANLSYEALCRHKNSHLGPWMRRMAERNAIAAGINRAGAPADATDAGLRALQVNNAVLSEWCADLLGTDDESREQARLQRGSPQAIKLIEMQGKNAERLMAAEERKERVRLLRLQRRLAEIVIETKTTDFLDAAARTYDQILEAVSPAARLEVERATERLRAERDAKGRKRRRALPA